MLAQLKEGSQTLHLGVFTGVVTPALEGRLGGSAGVQTLKRELK